MRFLSPFAVLLIALASGCTTCCHRACDLALKAESCPEVPADQRALVYTVIVRGFDPLHMTNAEKLREELNQQGFSKVYCVDFYHEAFIEKEVRRIRCETPDARFVIIGHSLGAGAALNLTTRLTQAGVPVDALVEIAPVYLPMGTLGQTTGAVGRHLVFAHSCTEPGAHQSRADVYRLESGYLTIASNPIAVQTIRGLLMESALRVPSPEVETPVQLPLVDDPAPLPSAGFETPDGTERPTAPIVKIGK